MPFVTFDELKNTIEQAFIRAGLDRDKAAICAQVHASSSCDGINSHGLNRVPRFCDYVQRGWIKIDAQPELVNSIGCIEVYDGQQGVGVTGALFATERAMELAQDQGVGIVALRNTTHWMRGGSYGWLAAESGFASICWTNTESVMPPWGSRECRIGNNPLVIAVPRAKGPLVLDMAMSQYSYGRLQTTRLKGEEMEFPAGYDAQGQLTRAPAEVEASRRILPTGLWKGSGLAIMLDVLAAVLSQGRPTNQIDQVGQGSGTGSSQIFMVFDPRKLGGAEYSDQLADSVAHYVLTAEPAVEGDTVLYPGASTIRRRADASANGISVDEEIWRQVRDLAGA